VKQPQEVVSSPAQLSLKLERKLVYITTEKSKRRKEMLPSTKLMSLNLMDRGEELQLDLVLTAYEKNSATALLLNDASDGSHYTTISINLPGYSEHLRPGEFYLKHWSENAQIAPQLIEQNIIEVVPAYAPVASGYVTDILVYRLTIELPPVLAAKIPAPNAPVQYTHRILIPAPVSADSWLHGYAAGVEPGQLPDHSWCYIRRLGMPQGAEWGHIYTAYLQPLPYPWDEETVCILERGIERVHAQAPTADSVTNDNLEDECEYDSDDDKIPF
jgi:hypothetical protein